MAAALAWLVLATDSAAPRSGVARLPQLLLAAIVVAAVAKLVHAGAWASAGSWLAGDPGAAAAVRTAVLAALALGLAVLARRRALPELGWLVYPLIVLGGLKLLLQDLRDGRPATLVLSLALYGLVLTLRAAAAEATGGRRLSRGPESGPRAGALPADATRFRVCFRQHHSMSAPARTQPEPDDEDAPERLRVQVPARLDAITPAVEHIMAVVGGMERARGKEFEIETALREALSNAIRHGCSNDETKAVEVVVACDENGGMVIVVRDPGPGFDPSRVPSPTVGTERVPAPRARDLPDQPADGRGLVRPQRQRDPHAQALGLV